MKIKIPNYENYELSSDGVVTNTNTGRKLKSDKTNRGYFRITLSKDGTTKRISLHRLVAELFIDNPLNKQTVNHKNGDKSDNSVSNLEWMTQSENQKHAKETGLCPRGEDNPANKYSAVLITKICEMIQQGVKSKDIREMLSVSKSLIDDIRGRRNWKHISNEYKW